MRFVLAAIVALPLFAQPSANILLKPGHEASQPVDDEYTKKIREYTTEPFFNSPLTDYLPASKTVPTPKAVLGDIAGAPGILPYSQDVYRYMRMLEKASPRVKVFSIGKTEEGREMIAVAVASEKLISSLEENRARLAKLADPRTINLDDAEAEAETRAGYEILVKQMDPKVTWLVNARKDLAEEYDALKQPEQAARFRAEAAALDSKGSNIAKK